MATLGTQKIEIGLDQQTHDLLSRMLVIQEYLLGTAEAEVAWDSSCAEAPVMRRFRCYRPAVPPGTHNEGTVNPPDEPQFEGVIFSDGTVCVRWLTAFRSHSIWNSWDDLDKVHGHPEYNSYIEWLDE
jgi:hypothetical protein